MTREDRERFLLQTAGLTVMSIIAGALSDAQPDTSPTQTLVATKEANKDMD